MIRFRIPKVLLVVKDYRTRSLFHSQISDYFRDSVEILTEEPPDIQCADLILLSSSQLVRDEFPPEKLLTARRSIDVRRLEELIALPNDANCLVVNNMKSTARETALLLKNLGFGFDMLPYYPGCPEEIPRNLDAVIIPGAIELFPSDTIRIINIGIRPLDLSTLIEMAMKLDLPVDGSNFYAARYIHEIVQLTRKLANTVIHLESLNRQLDTILNTVHDGIVASNAEGYITRMNQSALEMIGIKQQSLPWIGSHVSRLFPHEDTTGIFSSRRENVLLRVAGKHFVVNNTPVQLDASEIQYVTALQDVTRIQQLEQHLRSELQTKGLTSKYRTEHIIGQSPAIRQIIEVTRKISKSENTVIIHGESGTGKELVAHSIHHLSSRRDGPFVPVNFAGLPQSLAESELFGYEEGTFTGARKGGKPGLFELAHNGTIFLDEIGDAPLPLQSLLLRVLQEKHIMRVGGRKVIPVNVRVIAATNRDLRQLVSDGAFREDLYYRLNILPIRVPSLRARREDIPYLVEHFIKEYSPHPVQVSTEVMQRLVSYPWPGNVRELVGVIQYMLTVMDEPVLSLRELPEQLQAPSAGPPAINVANRFSSLEHHGNLLDFYLILLCLVECEEQGIRVGRGRMARYCESHGLKTSEQQIRKRMEVLSQLNCIVSGIRGQGSLITSRGREALQQLAAHFETYPDSVGLDDGKAGDVTRH
jgi:transcriptional regulator with PAS, ATPase and Fis domain